MKMKIKLPPSELELDEENARLKVRSFAKEEEDKRWSLQEEIAKPFDKALEYAFSIWGYGSFRISPCFKENGDYKCITILKAWPSSIKKGRYFRGPTHVALTVRMRLVIQETGMFERSFASGPGILYFTLSREWIARSIHKMIKDGIDTWAPKLSVERTILYFSSRNIAKKMSMGHLRSTLIGETLARMLEYSRVEVIRRFHEGNDMDIKSKMMMTEFLIERFPIGELNDQAIGEPEVFYEELKRFENNAEFRERSQQVWDERRQLEWEQICKISLECYQNVYHRLGFHVKEEDKSLYDPYISKTLDLLRGKGFTIDGEGVFIHGRKLPVADLVALWHGLDMVKADWIVHVTDLGQQDYIEKCINAAKCLGWIVNDHCQHSIRHAGFGLVEDDDLNRFVNLDDLLDEAKSHCKAKLMGQVTGVEWTAEKLEHTAEALGYGAVKYADLKNNRLTNYKFSFDQMFNEKGNTAVYLQYTHARVCSITKKYSKKINYLKNLNVRDETLKMKNEEERDWGVHLLRFTEILSEACKVAMPHILCDYLYDLCKKFDNLYSSVGEVCSGRKSELLLCEATRVVMKKCFYLLGITPIYNI